MSFVPQLPIDPAAVMGNFRVSFRNATHAGERFVDVALDTASDFAHQSTVYANSGLLSFMQLQLALLAARTCRDGWTAYADHGSRLSDHTFKYLDECRACRTRAMTRLYPEHGHADA